MAKRLDVVLLGATGFTGQYCIGELHRLSKASRRSLTWGIAGRSEEKLKEKLSQYQKTVNEDLSSVPIITADIKDYESLKKMTAQARVIINCCGPYRFFGERVIKACLETGTHQVDVTGEPQYMETIQLNYHKAAQEKGIYIVSACGFDSIPADLGLIFLQKNFEGTLNSVETYLKTGGDAEAANIPGSHGNYATWESAIHGIAHASELYDLRRKLYPTRLPTFTPKLNPRSSVHKSDIVDAWCIPFLGSDRSVMLRTQRYLYDQKKARPVQVQAYLGLESFYYLMLILIFGGLFSILTKFEFGRNLLLNHPKLFSAGFFAHENPPEEKIKKSKFSLILHGKGWSEKLTGAEDEYKTLPNKTIMGCVSGVNPGYGITVSAVTLAAIVILTETDKLPDRGGVYTPGAAFADTSLIQQLQENGLKFEILSNQ